METDEDRNSDAGGEGPDAQEPGLSLWQLVTSALAAASGVQSSRNRERDFSRGRPGQFIIIGVVLTVLFVLTMIGVVNLVLRAVA